MELIDQLVVIWNLDVIIYRNSERLERLSFIAVWQYIVDVVVKSGQIRDHNDIASIVAWQEVLFNLPLELTGYTGWEHFRAVDGWAGRAHCWSFTISRNDIDCVAREFSFRGEPQLAPTIKTAIKVHHGTGSWKAICIEEIVLLLVFGLQVCRRRQLHWLSVFVFERSAILEFIISLQVDIFNILQENAASCLTLTAKEWIWINGVLLWKFSAKVILLALFKEKGSTPQDGHLSVERAGPNLDLVAVVAIEASTFDCSAIVIRLEWRVKHFEIFNAV